MKKTLPLHLRSLIPLIEFFSFSPLPTARDVVFCLTVLLSQFSFTEATMAAEKIDKSPSISAIDKDQAIAKLIEMIRTKYVFPEVAEKLAKTLVAKQMQGAYKAVQSQQQFADVLSQDLLEITHDKHLSVRYEEDVIPVEGAEDPRSDEERRKDEEKELQEQIDHMHAINYGIQKIERLPGNIGYLDFRGFGPTGLVAPSLAAAMQLLSASEALIIDLRNNRGGSPDTVAFLVSYFTEAGVHLNDIVIRSENRITQKWSWPATPTPRYDAKKKVYVLTSSKTFSAAEDFSYTMQALKRSTTIGEVTGGGAHPVSGERLGEHLMGMVPFGRSINPITKTNWEGVGVIPDIRTSSDQALTTAHKLALENLLQSEAKEQKRAALQKALQSLTP